MAGKSRVTAGEEQRDALLSLAHSRDRGEADRARAMLLTLSGWTSPLWMAVRMRAKMAANLDSAIGSCRS